MLRWCCIENSFLLFVVSPASGCSLMIVYSAVRHFGGLPTCRCCGSIHQVSSLTSIPCARLSHRNRAKLGLPGFMRSKVGAPKPNNPISGVAELRIRVRIVLRNSRASDIRRTLYPLLLTCVVSAPSISLPPRCHLSMTSRLIIADIAALRRLDVRDSAKREAGANPLSPFH